MQKTKIIEKNGSLYEVTVEIKPLSEAFGRAKVYDKAAYHIDGGEDEKTVIAKFNAVFKFLNSKGLLTDEGKEILDTGIDNSVSLHSRMVTKEGNKFLKTHYNDVINKKPSEITKALNSYYKN